MKKIHLIIRSWPYEGYEVETGFLDERSAYEYVKKLNDEYRDRIPSGGTFQVLSTTIEDARIYMQEG